MVFVFFWRGIWRGWAKGYDFLNFSFSSSLFPIFSLSKISSALWVSATNWHN